MASSDLFLLRQMQAMVVAIILRKVFSFSVILHLGETKVFRYIIKDVVSCLTLTSPTVHETSCLMSKLRTCEILA